MVSVAGRRHVDQARIYDYLYDPSFVVAGARDHARTAFKAAMASAQIQIQPVYQTMFCEIRRIPRFNFVYYPNCRLPPHMDCSFYAAEQKQRELSGAPGPDIVGKDRYKFYSPPGKIPVPVTIVEPHLDDPFQIPMTSPRARTRRGPISRSMQTVYRESSAQTQPWQPDAVVSETCQDTPEVLYLDHLFWGPPFFGNKYRPGDLPVDFHTTEIINKLRHSRKWTKIVEVSEQREAIITDLETGDWVFREAEIDELQSIRLELLGEEVAAKTQRRMTRVQKKLHRLWCAKKQEMKSKVDTIHRNRDRELRKLTALHTSGGREGLAERVRVSRGGGDVTRAAADPASELYAPLTRHGYQARGRHAPITYYPDLLNMEERDEAEAEPVWLNPARVAARSAFQPRLPAGQPCERETKFGEEFLKTLHESLMKARLGAGQKNAGPCRLLVPRRRSSKMDRPTTPETDPYPDRKEAEFQASVLLQRTVRGRAVQMLMAEGCARAKQLIDELRTTHGLQQRDKERVKREQIAVRDLSAKEMDAERKEYRLRSLAAQLSGKALSAALDFLEKETRRLWEERKQHAFILVAKREKEMREAAEAGRRQLEEQRRYEHDLMFKQVVGVTQETVDAYLQDIIRDGADACADAEAERHARAQADATELEMEESQHMGGLEQNELVAQLVYGVAIPEVQRRAYRERVASMQEAGLRAVRQDIFGVTETAVDEKEVCTRCGNPLVEDVCKCLVCPVKPQPQEKPEHRRDPRWRYIRKRPHLEKDIGERYPPHHDFRCMLNCLVDEAVEASRARAAEVLSLRREAGEQLEEKVEMALDVKEYIESAYKSAVGIPQKPKVPKYHHFMYKRFQDAIKTKPPPCPVKRPSLLPSDIRQRAEAARLREVEKSQYCFCEDREPSVDFKYSVPDATGMMPSQLRALEELRRCKCDQEHVPPPSPTLSSAEAEAEAAVSDYDEEEEEVKGEEEHVLIHPDTRLVSFQE